MELNREAGESVLEIEGEIYKRTSVSSTRIRQKNKNESGCIRLCDKRSIIYGI